MHRIARVELVVTLELRGIWLSVYNRPLIYQTVESNRIEFLAYRTYGRGYAAVLRLSDVLTLCIVAKRRFLEKKLLLTAYRKSYYEK